MRFLCITPTLLSLQHSISFTESKPQQTGTRLLIGYGEVATTSGSTIPMESAKCKMQNEPAMRPQNF
jgi:hypothetical protein